MSSSILNTSYQAFRIMLEDLDFLVARFFAIPLFSQTDVATPFVFIAPGASTVALTPACLTVITCPYYHDVSAMASYRGFAQ